ncbi:arylesterase [Chelativorans sp. SCAU2101]|uniref:Arylesterase n=2 Tax=Chelativorans petroleitrophicus TaxID=2975484 RepID=A0A9X2X4Y0_9HYPH|nr:arylesterase [Chelativorans petroleitrophicus]MCT8989097.1 arylesterase [Chelativorans petroleitrophicus]
MVFAAAPAMAEPFRIIGFGDSLMAGYQLAPGESFPEQLEKALAARGHEVTVTNAGVSGDTTSGGLSRLDWSVPDGTDLVILELGANDMLRGLSPSATEKNLEAMITRLKERGVNILLVGMYAAPNLGPDYQEAFNAIYPRLAEKHDLPLVPFFLEGVAGNAAMQLDDRMHPNAQGVALMVENVLPAVEPLVAKERTDM